MTASTANVPPVARDPFNRAQDIIGFELNPGDSSNVVWTLDASGSQVKGDFRLSRARFRAIARDLLRAWQREIGFAGGPESDLQGRETLSDQRRAQLLRSLAAAGNFAWRELLDNMDSEMSARCRAVLSGAPVDFLDRANTLIFMCDFAFPWRLLYSVPHDPNTAGYGSEPVIRDDGDEYGGELPYEGFFGIRRVVDHALPVSSPISQRHGSAVAIGVSPSAQDLASAYTHELVETGFAEMLAGRVDLVPALSRDENSFAKSISMDNSALIYAFCHAAFSAATGGMLVQELYLQDHVGLTGSDLRRWISNATSGKGLSTSPVVFINACQGGVFGAADDNGIVDTLRLLGAGGTAGPLVDMPAPFACIFGKRVVAELLQHLTLSEAVHVASQYFVQEEGNPLGIAYATVNGRIGRLPQ